MAYGRYDPFVPTCVPLPYARWQSARPLRFERLFGLVDFGTMPRLRFVAPCRPAGAQPQAIDQRVDGLERGLRHQTLLGATGTGKTATLAWTIEKFQKPTLVLAHNKTLAAQLYAEFREFFPD